MFEEIIKIEGVEKGPTSTILAGVHGNEKCGIEAFQKILHNLKIENGVVFFIYGNPKAIESNKRFVEKNLNRMFQNDDSLTEEDKKSYEYNRAHFLKKYMDQSEVLLDVHGSNTENSRPFIICENNSKEISRYLPFDLVVSGFDKIEPGGTDYYMNSIGKIGICIECGYVENSKSTEKVTESILQFLKIRGHINPNTPITSQIKQDYIEMYYLYKTKTDKFVLSKNFDDFEEITKGQLIGIDGNETIKAEKDGVILFARNKDKIGEEAFLFGKKMRPSL